MDRRFQVGKKRIRKSTEQTSKAKAGEVAAEFLRQALEQEEVKTVPKKQKTPTLREFVTKRFFALTNATKREPTTKEYSA